MKDFLYSIIIAVTFLTIIPLPTVEWTGRRLRFLPLLMPFVGLGIGLLGYGLYTLLITPAISAFSSAVAMVLFYLIITGGLHMDGLMDTADAYFSRQSKEKKLEIMRDSRVGAFAVMAFVALLFIKLGLFYELFRLGSGVVGATGAAGTAGAAGAAGIAGTAGTAGAALLLITVPLLSRLGQAIMLCTFPFAREDGLAVMFRGRSGGGSKTLNILIIYFLLACLMMYFLSGATALILPLSLVLFTVFYYFSSKKNFGGITGDIAGAYVEMAEVLMLGALVFMF